MSLEETDNYCSGYEKTRMCMSLACCSGLSVRDVAYTYGPHIVLLVALLAITIFRKEMSCNHCYTEHEEKENGSSVISSSRSHLTAAAASQAELESRRRFDDLETDCLLEKAGCYCSGTFDLLVTILTTLHKRLPKAMANVMWESLSSWWVVAAERQRLDEILDGAESWCVSPPHAHPVNTTVSRIAEDKATHRKTCPTPFPAADGLPTDATVHILSFLHPKDVTSLSCVSQQFLFAIDDECSEISTALWKTLWYRDYAWIVEAWDVGREAANRSFQRSERDEHITTHSLGDVLFTKAFYFRFGLSYLNYVLAGQCTAERCLVGLGGHIYDLTGFLDQHPGSPETVIVHAGRDASAVFESMRHSISARKLAQQLCVTVDMSLTGGTGVRPTAKLVTDWGNIAEVDKDSSPGCHLPLPVDLEMPHGRPRETIFATLEMVRDDFMNEEDERRSRASSATDAVLGESHAYYDPFCYKWKAWYINTNYDVVFVDDL
jgi:hypothetical protein